MRSWSLSQPLQESTGFFGMRLLQVLILWMASGPGHPSSYVAALGVAAPEISQHTQQVVEGGDLSIWLLPGEGLVEGLGGGG